MTKWEAVFTEALASMMSGKSDELYQAWLGKRLGTEARSMCCIAAIIASEATKTMRTLQPWEHQR